MNGPSDLGPAAQPGEAAAPEGQTDRSGRARRLAEMIELRLRQTVRSRAVEETAFDVKYGGAQGPTRFSLRLHTPEPERSLSIAIDPIAGTLSWSYHYAGALMRGQTVALRDVDERYVDGIVRPFEDDRSWRGGRFAIRADRVSGARD